MNVRGRYLGSHVLLLFCLPALWADPGGWTSLGPNGGQITSLSIDPHHAGTAYAATWGQVLFKTTDGGTTWIYTAMPNGRVVFDPQDPATMYVAQSGVGVSKSTDGGVTWNDANSGLPWNGAFLPVQALAIDPENPAILYAATERGIFQTRDGGGNWSASSDTAAYALAVDPRTPSTLYAIVRHSGFCSTFCMDIVKSTDRGASWKAAGSSSTLQIDPENISLVIDPANPSVLYTGAFDGVYKSVNGGQTWAPVNFRSPAIAVAINPRNSQVLYAQTRSYTADNVSESVFVSVDGGANWRPAPLGSFPRLPMQVAAALTVDPNNPSAVYVLTVRGLFRSLDGGSSWMPAGNGISAVATNNLTFDPQDPATLYVSAFGAGFDTGIYKVSGGGATWTKTSAPPGKLVFDPEDPDVVYDGIFKSGDGGANWTQIRDGIAGGVAALAVDPQNSANLYALTEQYECDNAMLLKSMDGGATWTSAAFKDAGVSGSCVEALLIDPGNSSTLYAGFSSGVFKSVDAGATWSPANGGMIEGLAALAMDPVDSNTLYAVAPIGMEHTDDDYILWGVFQTTDGATTWKTAGDLPAPLRSIADCCFAAHIAIDPRNPAAIYVGGTGSHHVFRSADAGATWTDSGLAVPGSGIWDLAVSPQGTVYVGTYGAGLFAKSFDPGN
jgi:photosystem II stability/assembly factor-like uncharacterized protein